ncbi:HEAT repeat domain-containing protein [Dactylosporangium sp. NPDC049525]|uniref:HEAT repeat domain-containing protein n=1 Tax=Dactylosporangium sp. NPDC049525 TaxID=3154730 RepID=UPI003434ED69
MTARDPIPETRAAIRRLVADVGGPGLDSLLRHVPADEDGKPTVARSTLGDLLTGPAAKPRVPLWRSVAAAVGACETYHRTHAGRAAHEAMVRGGRFDLAVWQVMFAGETGAAAGRESEVSTAWLEYLSRVRDRYGRVDLEILTPLTEQGEHPVMLLEQIFMPQRVRADLPPVEVPREVWQRLADAGLADADSLPEQLDRDKLKAQLDAYRTRPTRAVLDVISDPGERKLVVLGDPGAGKSTLARFLLLALADASGQRPASGTAMAPDLRTPGGQVTGSGLSRLSGWLPVLVELRTYADMQWRSGPSATFFDLLDHLHRTQHVGLPRNVLEPLLDAGRPILVVFDGLDEVFDSRQRAEITAQIEGFAAKYPRVRVVVTSRVVGYQRAMLDAAGFTHWMLQDLDREQIGGFTACWYTRSCPTDPAQATRLQHRLLAAIDASTAVAELAGNPMLLTILAIIGRRRELPRDRRSVYEHAVTVLIEHWDVNRQLRDKQLDIDYLDAQDKLELLHLVARHMQDGPAGLAGNHIPGPILKVLFRQYLEARFALTPDRSIPAARTILAKFQERDFILARFGSEVYGFVHRAFLEYLAAGDLARRLTSFDIDAATVVGTYDRHWPEAAWTEVLLLLTGMIPEKVAVLAIRQLLRADPRWRVRRRLPRHLLIALQATTEIRKTTILTPLAPDLTNALITLLEEVALRDGTTQNDELSSAVERLAPYLLRTVSPAWIDIDRYHVWHRSTGNRLTSGQRYLAARTAAAIHIQLTGRALTDLQQKLTDRNWATREAAVQAIASGWPGHADTLIWLRDRATTDDNWDVRQAAVQAIATGWPEHPDTLTWLRDRATTDDDNDVRQAAVQVIASGWPGNPDTLTFLRDRATTDDNWAVRQAAVQAIATGWPEDPDTLTWLRDRATIDDDNDVRRAAVQAIASGWPEHPDTLTWLRDRATTDDNWAVRRAAVGAVASGWPGHSDTLTWLRDRATIDDDNDVRRAAVGAVASGWPEDPDTLSWLRDRATTDDDWAVRRAAVQAVASGWPEHPATLSWLRDRATTDDNEVVRQAAVGAVASGWPEHSDTLTWLRTRATTDDNDDVRRAAVGAVASGWPEHSDTLIWLRDRATTDDNDDVRQVVVQVIARGWSEHPDTLTWLRDRATIDDDWAVRRGAVGAVASGWPEHPATLSWLRDRATTDDNWAVRQAAVGAVASCWPEHSDTLIWLRDRATIDDNDDVRRAAVQAVASGWPGNPDTLTFLRDRATTDDSWAVRQAAVRAVVSGWPEDPDTLIWLRDRATTDDNNDVRQAAVQATRRLDRHGIVG